MMTSRPGNGQWLVIPVKPTLPEMNGKGEGRTLVVLLLAGFAVIVLAMVALGTRYLSAPSSSTDLSDSGSSTPRPSKPMTREPGLGDISRLDLTEQPVRATAGATIVAPGRIARLEIPAGALETDSAIQVARLAVDHPLDLTGFAIDLLPDGLQLLQPARLSMTLPAGVDAAQIEIAVFDPQRGGWFAEQQQQLDRSGTSVSAQISHFSLRRLRVRPGMRFPSQLPIASASVRLESDADAFFERYVAGRWELVPRGSSSYRELVSIGRRGRMDLIKSGRLRSIAGASRELGRWSDRDLLASVPIDSPLRRTGWVKLERLNGKGEPSGSAVIAEVVGLGPNRSQQRAGIGIVLSRASVEALGLSYSREFGVEHPDDDISYLRVPSAPGLPPKSRLPIRVTPAQPPILSAP
jgi:hypothetical protein